MKNKPLRILESVGDGLNHFGASFMKLLPILVTLVVFNYLSQSFLIDYSDEGLVLLLSGLSHMVVSLISSLFIVMTIDIISHSIRNAQFSLQDHIQKWPVSLGYAAILNGFLIPYNYVLYYIQTSEYVYTSYMSYVLLPITVIFIFLSIKFMFVYESIIISDMNVFEAIKNSFLITKNRKSMLLMLFMLFGFVGISMGFVALLVLKNNVVVMNIFSGVTSGLFILVATAITTALYHQHLYLKTHSDEEMTDDHVIKVNTMD